MPQDKFNEKMNTIQGEVQTLMVKYDTMRDYDIVLIFKYLDKHLGLKMPKLDDVHIQKYASICESVRRSRQRIQATGVLLPTSPEIRKKRKISEEQWRAWAVDDKVD